MNLETARPQSTPLPRRLKLLYSTGDLSTSIPLAILMFFQLYFLTDVAGLPPQNAAWAIGAGRVWDAINDPLFGLVADRIRSPWGRRRVLLLFGAVPLGVSFALMWIVPPLGTGGLTLYYTLSFLLFDTVFTMVHVGYNALTPELTSDYDERSSLNGYRMVFSISGTLGAIILTTVLGWVISDVRLLYSAVGIGLGLATMVPPLIAFAATEELPLTGTPKPLPVRQAVAATLGNRPFWLVMAMYLLSWTTASILAANLIYFADYFLRVPDQANFFVLVAMGSAIAFIPLWVWVARRLDKRIAFVLGTASWIAVLLAISGIQPDQLTLAYTLAFLAGSGIATAYVIPWSMVPDIIEVDQAVTGQRREGAYYAFASFFQKAATGVALWAMGMALAASGYITPDTDPNAPLPVQPPKVVDAIRVFMGPVPSVLLILALLFAWRYPISRERHRELVDELTVRENTPPEEV
jgi:GPH family glycoside/pentoside/hexuronide:cation symporter